MTTLKPKYSALKYLFCVGFFMVGAHVGAASPNPETILPPAFESLKADLEKGPMYKKILVLDALRKRNTHEAYDLIVHAMLYDKAKPVRRHAQFLMQGIELPRMEKAILAALNAGDLAVVKAAVDALRLSNQSPSSILFYETLTRYAKNPEMVRFILEAIRDYLNRVNPPAGFENALHPYLLHKEKSIVQTAVICLGVMGRPGSLPYLMPLWKNAPEKTKIHLADALANIGLRESVGLLKPYLRRETPKKLLLHCLYAVSQIQSFECLPQIQKLAQSHPDPQVGMACIYAMIELEDPSNEAIVKSLLNASDPSVLHWAIFALGEMRSRSATPDLLWLLSAQAPLVRATAATTLATLGAVEAEPLLLQHLCDPDEQDEVRQAAAEALLSLGAEIGAAVMARLLAEPFLDFETRMILAVLRAGFMTKAEEGQLQQTVAGKDYESALLAGLTLANANDPAGKELLISGLEHGYPSIREQVILALRHLAPNDPGVVKALASTANDDHVPQVRILAAQALVATGYPEYRVILWDALDNENPDVRQEAVVALGENLDPEVREQLKWYLKREPSIPVRATVLRVLKK